ncbi:MAG: hypothetical protein K8H74_14040 [Notoacmeibacter sp.]|nr:hypothetical protein [Notoacmeibacter sp.]
MACILKSSIGISGAGQRPLCGGHEIYLGSSTKLFKAFANGAEPHVPGISEHLMNGAFGTGSSWLCEYAPIAVVRVQMAIGDAGSGCQRPFHSARPAGVGFGQSATAPRQRTAIAKTFSEKCFDFAEPAAIAETVAVRIGRRIVPGKQRI